MARYLLTQYNNKVPNNPRNKRGDRNTKKGDDAKFEDSNTTTMVGGAPTPCIGLRPKSKSNLTLERNSNLIFK